MAFLFNFNGAVLMSRYNEEVCWMYNLRGEIIIFVCCDGWNYFLSILWQFLKLKKLKIKSKCLPCRALWRARKPLKSDRRRISSFSKYNTFLILSESFSTKIVGSSYIHEHKECLFEEASLNFECEIWNFSPILLNKGNLFTNKKKKTKKGATFFNFYFFNSFFNRSLLWWGVQLFGEIRMVKSLLSQFYGILFFSNFLSISRVDNNVNPS